MGGGLPEPQWGGGEGGLPAVHRQPLCKVGGGAGGGAAQAWSDPEPRSALADAVAGAGETSSMRTK